jgi:hypothetical protein
MADIFNYAGDASPSNVKLTDPTILSGATNGSITVTGVACAMAIGTVIASGDATQVCTGISCASATGTVVATGPAGVASTGVSSASAIGTVVLSGLGSITQTGTGATNGIGTSVISGTATVVQAGSNATSAEGSTITTAGALIAATGVEGVGAAGDEAAGVYAEATATGTSLAGAIGTAVLTANSLFVASGSSTQSSTGTAMASSDEETFVEVTGVEAISSLGTVTARGHFSRAGAYVSSGRGFQSVSKLKYEKEEQKKRGNVQAGAKAVNSSFSYAKATVVRGIASVFEATLSNAELHGWAMRTRQVQSTARDRSVVLAEARVEDVDGVMAALGLEDAGVLELL